MDIILINIVCGLILAMVVAPFFAGIYFINEDDYEDYGEDENE